ncbi:MULTISPECIES: MauE/DoxX family redox-associated membrane protein [unclassified Streptomyces]|uniref:MauE/DoxX family redox-associated membrane protein n=1 Tax=unclassified Streptomyces TaxID=2593676 RepID=UPI0037F75460
MSSFEIAARSLIGTVFLISSVSKARSRESYQDFAHSLAQMRVVPLALEGSATRLVVIAEFAVWALLAVPTAQAGWMGQLLAAGLLAAFTVGILRTVRRRSPVTCPCFGVSSTPLGGRHIVRNALLTGVALSSLLVPASGPASAGKALVAALVGLVMGLVTAVLDEIFALFQPITENDTSRSSTRFPIEPQES